MANGHALTVNDVEELNQYKGAVFIFMSPNDVSGIEKELIKLKEQE